MSAQPRRSFFTELKRRHVYRVSVLYAAVAFVIWQVTDLVVPALGLPEWVLTVVVVGAIVAFPFVAVVAWAFEVTPSGIRLTSAVDAEAASGDVVSVSYAREAAHSSAFWRRVAIGGGAAAVLVSGLWWVAASRVQPRADLSGVTLAVFPFAVRGDDAGYLREGVVDLLSRNLSGAMELHALDPALMLKVTRGAQPEDTDAAGAIARRVGAGQFVTGSVHQVAGRLRIDAALYELGDSISLLAAKNVEGDTTELFDLIDRLTAGLLTNRSTGAASDRLVRTAAAMTSSLPALKAYLQGEQKYRLGAHEDAVDAFQRALAEDSTFVLARYRLAISHHMRMEHHTAHREIQRVLRDEARLGAQDRRLAHAFHAYHDGDGAEAEQQLRAIIRDYPRDLEARVILAELQISYAPTRGEPLSEAKQLLQEVLEADPKFACIHCALSTAAMAAGDTATATRALRLYHGRSNGDTTKLELPAQFMFAALSGDSATVYDVVQRLDTATYGRAHVAGANYSLRFGRPDLADAFLARAVATGAPAAGVAAMFARVSAERGQWTRARAQQDSLIAAAGMPLEVKAAALYLNMPFEIQVSGRLYDELLRWEPAAEAARDVEDAWPAHMRAATRHYFLGLTVSRAGDDAAARAWADSLTAAAARPQLSRAHARVISGMAHTVRADLALRAHDGAAALRELDRMDVMPPPALLLPWMSAPLYAGVLRVQAHRAVGEHEAALRWLQRSMAFTGIPDSGHWAVWQRDMAATLDALGRGQEAVPYYARFVNAWQHADAALQPQVDAARARLAMLSAR